MDTHGARHNSAFSNPGPIQDKSADPAELQEESVTLLCLLSCRNPTSIVDYIPQWRTKTLAYKYCIYSAALLHNWILRKQTLWIREALTRFDSTKFLTFKSEIGIHLRVSSSGMWPSMLESPGVWGLTTSKTGTSIILFIRFIVQVSLYTYICGMKLG